MDHVLTIEDLILGISLFFNLLTIFGLLVVMDIRFTYWRQKRKLKKMEKQENMRNPVYGIRR